ncbi:MAG: NADH-quinone oxidoreductase subunit C [Bacteroidia bacterium]
MLKEKISALFPEAVIDETGEILSVQVDASKFRALAIELRNDSELKFDYLFCITAVDWKTHFTVVYHFESTEFRHRLVVKAKIDNRDNPEVETVCDIWRTAELQEREAYDLMGIRFIHHPDLRRLLLTDDWQGWPLRKDYDDPVNMIKL